jgi:hypothetical protein
MAKLRRPSYLAQAGVLLVGPLDRGVQVAASLVFLPRGLA